jgi:hypothetical protein
MKVFARGRAIAIVAAVAVGLRPELAAACASCLSSGFGDRTYSWPYLALLVMPFIVAGVIGAVLYRYRGGRAPADALSSGDTLLDKETT